MRDVGIDGIMCIEGKATDTCDKIQSIQWIAITVAGIISSLAGGYIADHFNYKLAFLWLISVYLLAIVIVLRYKSTVLQRRTGDCRDCHYCLDCEGSENNTCSSFRPRTIKKKNVHILETIRSYKELFTDKKFLLVCIFIFLYNYSPSFGTPLMFIQRDHWRWSGTWMGILGAISSVFSIIGAYIFYKICKKIDYKKWLKISVLVGACTTLCYLYYTPVTCVIYDILFSVSGMFVLLMLLSLMAKSTLTGKEATSFALLCSVNNLAGTCSTLSGAYLFPKIGLTYMILLSAITSFACLPLIRRLEIQNENK
jgi:predicted MFS family arabinose efflux permease